MSSFENFPSEKKPEQDDAIKFYDQHIKSKVVLQWLKANQCSETRYPHRIKGVCGFITRFVSLRLDPFKAYTPHYYERHRVL